MKNPEYIAHGSASAESVKNIEDEGFKFEEGRETVSTDFFLGMDFAQNRPDTMAGSRNENPISDNDPGSIIIMRVPEGYRVGYGTETHVDLDEDGKEITGHVGKYAGGRRQLGVYRKELSSMGVSVDELAGTSQPLAQGSEMMSSDMDLDKKVEALKKLELVLDAENIAAEIKATPSMIELTDKLKEEVFSLKIDIPEAARKIAEEIEKENENSSETIHHFKDRDELEDILTKMLEGSLINQVQQRIRKLSLQIKMLDGYVIKDQDKIPGMDFIKPDKEEVGNEIKKLISAISEEGFTTGLSNLDRYLSIHLGHLREEFSKLG